MSEGTSGGERLDSWKAIAEYLQRDVATVRRWEKALGLPIHRVAGTGRSVFAYTSEIDDWLNRAKPLLPVVEPLLPMLETAPAAAAMPAIRAFRWRWLVAAAALVVAAGLFARLRPTAADDVHVELTSAGLVARDSSGSERWRHMFPATSKTFVDRSPVRVIGGTSPGVYFATSNRASPTNDRVESGMLTLLDLQGRPQRSFSFDDQVMFQGKAYGAPWAVAGFDVNEADESYRVAVTAHHYTWDPGLVTILDAQWQRRGTFVHAGWIEQVRWLGPERLLIGGFSNAHDGGMIALLDAAALDGQGPEPPDSPYFCATCGPDRPLRMFVLPRSEVNRASASRFNRVLLQTFADGRLFARTVEMTSAGGDAVAVYELTTSLELVSARFGERYWEMHRALEAEGRLTHTREQCPDREGPRQVRRWDRTTGWQTVTTR